MHTKDQIEELLAPEREIEKLVSPAVEAFKALMKAQKLLLATPTEALHRRSYQFVVDGVFRLRDEIERIVIKCQEERAEPQSLLSKISAADLVSLWAGVGLGANRFVIISDGLCYEVLDRVAGRTGSVVFQMSEHRKAQKYIQECHERKSL